jgi:hypothetical protein
MSEPREPLHQPPNPDDLRRAPPASPNCARVRGWLRDFVDRDLDAPRAAELEEHVHRCRTCAVELARTEHETMRLRGALAALPGAHAALPPDFPARVVERLVVDETSIVPKDTLARAAALATAQANAGAPVGDAPDRLAPRARESGPRVQPAMLLIASALLLWGLTFGVEVFGGWFQGPRNEGRLLIAAATDAFCGDRRLGVGDFLGEKQSIHVRPRGEAIAEWNDATSKEQPAATFKVHGDGEVTIVGGTPRLHGQVDVDTSRSVSVTLSDGSCLELGRGSYAIAAELRDDPMSSLPWELRVKVEVRSGEPAAIVRSGFGPTLVAAGQLGVFLGNSPASVVTMGGNVDVAAVPATRRQPNEEVAAPASLLIAHALDQAGGPVGQASVRLRGGRSRAVSATLSSANDGTLQLSCRLDTDFLIAQGVPPEWRGDLGFLPPDAYRLLPQGPNQELTEPLQFRTATNFIGQVYDEGGLACEDVQVVPCIVDNLFGAVRALVGEPIATDVFGGFRCLQLPARLPPHQSLRLLLLRDDLAPTVVAIPERSGSLAALPFPPIAMRHTHPVSVQMLSANSAVEILEEIPGLPEGTGLLRHAVTTDGSGTIASLPVGSSSPVLWWRDLSAGNNIRQLTFLAIGEQWVFRPNFGIEPFAFGSKFGATAPIAGSTAEIVATERHESLADIGDGTMPVVMQFADKFGYPVVAQVFVVDPSGPRGRVNAHFAGFTASDGVVTVRRRAEQTVVVVAPDGSCLAVGAQAPLETMHIPPTGRLQVDPSLRPGAGGPSMMALSFRRTDLLVPGQTLATTRFAAAPTNWEVRDLVPGQYVVTVGNVEYTVTVPSDQSVMLQP